MLFRQLFDKTSSTYTYLMASRRGGEALLIGCGRALRSPRLGRVVVRTPNQGNQGCADPYKHRAV